MSVNALPLERRPQPATLGPDRHRPAVDAVITVLADEIGPEAVLELLESFLADTPFRLDELESMAGGTDQATLRRCAHSLKGSASLFGAAELERAALRLENLAAERRMDGQQSQAMTIRSVFEETRIILDEMVDQLTVR